MDMESTEDGGRSCIVHDRGLILEKCIMQDLALIFLGPNSNTAADNIIERARGSAPNVQGAYQQNYGETMNYSGSYWVH